MEVHICQFRPHVAGAKVGFADVIVPDLGLLVRDVAIFDGHRGRWAKLPARRIPADGGGVRFLPYCELIDQEQGVELEAAIAEAIGPHLEGR